MNSQDQQQPTKPASLAESLTMKPELSPTVQQEQGTAKPQANVKLWSPDPAPTLKLRLLLPPWVHDLFQAYFTDKIDLVEFASKMRSAGMEVKFHKGGALVCKKQHFTDLNGETALLMGTALIEW